MKKRYEGFSLIEILVVVALIIILAAITIIAINPAKNFRDTRNAQRASDVNAILNAVTQYTSEQNKRLSDLGSILPCENASGDPQSTKIGSTPSVTTGDYVDLAPTLVESADLIVAIPMDPSTGTEEDTGYTICETSGGRVQIAAPGAEQVAEPIVVKR